MNTSKKPVYTSVIRNIQGSIVLEIGNPIKPIKRKPKKTFTKINPGHISITGVKKELLEYHYGIYRMFPCGKQHNYHMRFIHVPGVTERRIVG